MTTRVGGLGFEARPFFDGDVQLLEGVVVFGSGTGTISDFIRNRFFRETWVRIFRLGTNCLFVALAFPGDFADGDRLPKQKLIYTLGIAPGSALGSVLGSSLGNPLRSALRSVFGSAPGSAHDGMLFVKK